MHIYFQNKGRHHLTYPIKKHNDGIYLHGSYQGNGQIIKKVEKVVRFDEQIIRHMTIKQG